MNETKQERIEIILKNIMTRFAFNPLVCKVYCTFIYLCLQVTLFFIGSNLTGVICGPVAESFPLTVFLLLVEKISLLPGFHIEKVTNTRNRAYVFELTSQDKYLCLSADEQKSMDVFVFMLMSQLKLKEQIKGISCNHSGFYLLQLSI